MRRLLHRLEVWARAGWHEPRGICAICDEWRAKVYGQMRDAEIAGFEQGAGRKLTDVELVVIDRAYQALGAAPLKSRDADA